MSRSRFMHAEQATYPVTLLCRVRGQWPTWCVGARRLPPFAAHAWVEADGIMVGEDYPPDYFRTLFTVP